MTFCYPRDKGFSSRMPRRAPELLPRTARWGRRRDAARCRRARDGPSGNPRQKLRSAGLKRHPGGLSLGYFSLAKQRKVTRLSVREPTYKKLSRQRLILICWVRDLDRFRYRLHPSYRPKIVIQTNFLKPNLQNIESHWYCG